MIKRKVKQKDKDFQKWIEFQGPFNNAVIRGQIISRKNLDIAVMLASMQNK